MTDIGYDHILEKIREHVVEPPEDFSIEQLQSWILGYTCCMTEIVKIIGDLKEERRPYN